MVTTRVNLDTTQYVRVTSDPLQPSSLLLQSHRDTVRIAFSDVKPARDNTVFHELGEKDGVLNVPLTETAAWALATSDRCALTATEQRAPVEVSEGGSIGQSVFVNDQTTDVFDIFFTELLSTGTLAVDTVAGEYSFTASPGHGIVAGDTVSIFEPDNDKFFGAEVGSVAGDVITCYSPIPQNYSAANAIVQRLNNNMLVDGSVTPRIFSVVAPPWLEGDITRVIITIDGDGDMDFTTFGSSPSLTRGCLLRVNKGDGTYQNIFNWHDNGEFIERSFDHQFLLPQGGNTVKSFVGRRTFAGQSKNGVVIRLNGAKGESLEVVVQDNINGDNIAFKMIAQGHLTQ